LKDLQELVLGLVGTNSETENEQELSYYLRKYCTELGFDEVIQNKTGNVIAIIDNRPGKVINFNGHMDTKQVPDDLEVRVEDGRIYGRGSSDMKGSIATMLDSATDLMNRKREFSGKVVYSFVVCEESGILGVRLKGTPSVISYLKEIDCIPDAVVIGEASQIYEKDPFTIVYGQRGRYICDVRINGEKAHGGFGAKLGVNASAIAGLAKWNLFRYAKVIGQNSLNVSDGPNDDDSHNNVPGEAYIQIDVRFVSNNDLAIIKRGIERNLVQAVEKAEKHTGKGSFDYTMADETYGPCDFTNAEILGAAKKAYESVNGVKPNLAWSVFGTDASFYVSEGIFRPDKPNIIIAGPGSQEMAHTSNESVSVQQLKQYSKIFTQIAMEYLK